MHQGNWKCSSCGGTITELPFMPRSESGLTCRSCYGKQKDRDAQAAPEMPVASEAPDIPDYAEVAGEPSPQEDDGFGPAVAPVERTKFAGKWQCSQCNGPIASLPFEPKNTSNLKCIDCFKKSRG